MKKLLIALTAVMISVASYAQGTVSFNTKIGTSIDAPVTIGSASGPGVGDQYTGELYVVSGGTVGVIASSKTPFRTVPAGGNAALAKYVVTVSSVTVPGTTEGGSATLRFRAYLTSAGSWDAADQFSRGASSDFTVTLGVQPPGTPANLVGITGFSIPAVPEPTTIALGVLGATALLFRRRK